MTRKQSLLMIALMTAFPIIILAVTVGIRSIMPPPPPAPNVTKASFDLIADGMSENEVEELFGMKGIFVHDGLEPGRKRIVHWLGNDRASWAALMFVDGRMAGKHWNYPTGRRF